MRGIICQAATPRYLEGHWCVGPGHDHHLASGHCFNCNGLEYMSNTGIFDPVAGFPPAGLSLAAPIRSRHYCEDPGRVFVWIVPAATVTKVVEGYLYLRRRYYAILWRFKRRVRALRSPTLLCPLSVL